MAPQGIISAATMAGGPIPYRSSTRPMKNPPNPAPRNCSEKASEGTWRGQENSAAIGLSATTTRNMAPEPISNVSTEATST